MPDGPCAVGFARKRIRRPSWDQSGCSANGRPRFDVSAIIMVCGAARSRMNILVPLLGFVGPGG